MQDCGYLVTCSHGQTFCGKVNAWGRRIKQSGVICINHKTPALLACQQRMERHLATYHQGEYLNVVAGGNYVG